VKHWSGIVQLNISQMKKCFAEFNIPITSDDTTYSIEAKLHVSIVQDRRVGKPVIRAWDVSEGLVTSNTKIDHGITEYIDPFLGLHAFQARNLASSINLPYECWAAFSQIVVNLSKCYLACDATAIEIDPLIFTNDNQLLVMNGSLTIDDYALLRQPRFHEFIKEHPPPEPAIKPSYIPLHGTIGCITNGAGLGMATIDAVGRYGQEAHRAGSLVDLGIEGTLNNLKAGIEATLSNHHIDVLLFNLFAALTPGQEIARQLIQALSDIQMPTVIRLEGLRAIEGIEMIEAARMLHVTCKSRLSDAAKQAVLAAQGNPSWRS
jgi:succinyl-CoA synthetase beta subunit